MRNVEEVCFMEVLYKRCCGIDIHKNMMVACVFTSVSKKEIRQFSTMTEDILLLVSWLKETGCEMAAMESTGSYWKPVYNIFEEEQISIIVVNAQHIKGGPGCKTDVKDAEWIAARRGGKRGLIAIAHTMLIPIYHMLKEKVPFCDLGADYYSVINQEKIIKRNLRSLKRLGVDVMIQPK